MTRRTVKNQLTIIYWRDIPAQVTARSGREKATFELPRRFQAAIDRAAAVAGKEHYDDYIGEWRRETSNCSDDLQGSVDAAVAVFEADYPRERLKGIVEAGGYDPTKPSTEPSPDIPSTETKDQQ